MDKRQLNKSVLQWAHTLRNNSKIINNSSNNSFQDLYDDNDTEYRTGIGLVPRITYISFIYIILIFGVVGNVVVFALMQHSWYRRKSYSVYLRFLAVADSFLLITVCMEDILDHQFHVLSQLYGTNLFVCRLLNFNIYLPRLLSPWLIVLLTIDRYLAVVFPLKRSVLCTLKVSLKVSMAVTFIILLESCVVSQMSSFEVVAEDDYRNCEIHSVSVTYDTVRSLIFQSSLPCLILLILNTHIIITIRRSQKFRESSAATGNNRDRSTAVGRGTMSLVAVSVMAFCALMPIMILEVLEYSWAEEHYKRMEKLMSGNITEDVQPGLEFYMLKNASDTWPLLNLIYLINFGQNFYILILFQPRYRKALQSYVQCKTTTRRTNDSKRISSGIDRSSDDGNKTSATTVT